MVLTNNITGLIVAREFSRVKREPSRIIGMLVQPLIFLVVFGMGFHKSFRLSDHVDLSYSSFFYPGVLALVVLFASIYATLTLVDDKKCGFFRLVFVSPAGVFGALRGKIVATTLLGFSQSLLFLPLMFFLSIKISFSQIIILLVILFLGALCFALLGVLFAWLAPTSSAFHALMSIILIPMWLLSGAMFPLDNIWLSSSSVINPMAYLVKSLRCCLLQSEHWIYHALVLALFCVFFALLLMQAIKRRPIE
jgi:ABC-2 type transport system permease protein